MSATSSTGTKAGRPDGGPKNVGPRMIAIVGPYGSGKTTLLESMLHAIGVTNRKGAVAAGNTVGDSSAEARGLAYELRKVANEDLRNAIVFFLVRNIESSESRHETLDELDEVLDSLSIDSGGVRLTRDQLHDRLVCDQPSKNELADFESFVTQSAL